MVEELAVRAQARERMAWMKQGRRRRAHRGPVGSHEVILGRLALERSWQCRHEAVAADQGGWEHR